MVKLVWALVTLLAITLAVVTTLYVTDDDPERPATLDGETNVVLLRRSDSGPAWCLRV